LAVIVKPCPPTDAALGLTNVSTEEDVWMERFVLYWEQADASAHATNATISHLREHIRTRSSRAILPGRQADKNALRSIRVLRKSAMIQFSAGSTLYFHPRWGETFSVKVEPAPENRKNPHQTGLFLIPPEDAQVNLERPHTAYLSDGVMHSARQTVARRGEP
jgi:hypothetical protein